MKDRVATLDPGKPLDRKRKKSRIMIELGIQLIFKGEPRISHD
jgi:hypothetical protein